MIRILVTGATSFIGVHLINQLLNNGCKVYAVIRPNSNNISRLSKHKNLYIIEKKLKDLVSLQNDLEEKIDIFYHLAWDGTRAPYRDDAKLQESNYDAAVKAFELSIILGCKKFLGIGSQAEYGKTKGLITENYPTVPLTEYGKAKLKSFKTISDKAEENKIEFIWARIFSVYGKYDYDKTLIMSALEKMRVNDNLPLTLGTQNWNYLYVDDAALMLVYLGLFPCEDGGYNLASADNRKLKDYITELKNITKSKSRLQFGAVNYNSEGPVDFLPCIDKFSNNFKGFNFIPFREGILKLL